MLHLTIFQFTYITLTQNACNFDVESNGEQQLSTSHTVIRQLVCINYDRGSDSICQCLTKKTLYHGVSEVRTPLKKSHQTPFQDWTVCGKARDKLESKLIISGGIVIDASESGAWSMSWVWWKESALMATSSNFILEKHGWNSFSSNHLPSFIFSALFNLLVSSFFILCGTSICTCFITGSLCLPHRGTVDNWLQNHVCHGVASKHPKLQQ